MSRLDLNRYQRVEGHIVTRSWGVGNYTIMRDLYASVSREFCRRKVYAVFVGEQSNYTLKNGAKPFAIFATKKEAFELVNELESKRVKLKDRVKAVVELNKQMHDDIVAFLKKHNGLVRTDNTERRDLEKPLCGNIYVISMDGDDEPNTEKRVLAVALIGEEQVAVLPDYGEETISGMSDQEVLDCDNWEWINGGYVLQNATLTSICECIEEYV